MIDILVYGRLGNKLIQIINAIHVNLKVFKHRYISIQNLKKNDIVLSKFPDVYIFSEFFHKPQIYIKDFFWKGFNTQPKFINDIINTYIEPYIDYNVINKDINFDTDLIIHIRSGDIFLKRMNPNYYIQPPLSFYVKIIEYYTFKKYIIVTESNESCLINPVIPYLLEKYKDRLILISNTIDFDFKILINAKYIVHSCTTLSKMCSYLSRGKQCIYTCQKKDMEEFLLNKRFKVIYIDYSNYFKNVYDNAEEKVEKMLDYIV